MAAVGCSSSLWRSGAAWVGLGRVSVAVRGDVPVRGRRQAADLRSHRLGTQEMGGSRCGSATRVRTQLDQGHFGHHSWVSLSQVLIGSEKNCAYNQVTAAGLTTSLPATPPSSSHPPPLHHLPNPGSLSFGVVYFSGLEELICQPRDQAAETLGVGARETILTQRLYFLRIKTRVMKLHFKSPTSRMSFRCLCFWFLANCGCLIFLRYLKHVMKTTKAT